MYLLFSIIVATCFKQVFLQTQESCDSEIYCQGPLLHDVQLAKIYNDSKTFVDLTMKNSSKEILESYDQVKQQKGNDLSTDDIKKFVEEHFEDGKEIVEWSPPDWKEKPPKLQFINKPEYKKWANDLNALWKTFARKVAESVKENPERHSIIPVEHGFIVPGGRFKEFYYWDTYWIIKGLLLCDMKETVRGMLENFFSLVNKYGFVPNGARVYYLNRSQPPLLTAMVWLYFDATGNYTWLGEHIEILEKELSFWSNKRSIQVQKHEMYHYACESGTPRPESYREDYETASNLTDETEKQELYKEIKSAAESGWDFSSRWMRTTKGNNEGSLIDAHTRDIIPVDLNSFLCEAYGLMARLYGMSQNQEKANMWYKKYKKLQIAIDEVLYNKEDGIWYDYDVKTSKQRKYFYPSNLAPLLILEPSRKKKQAKLAVLYLKKKNILKYEGGIPTSLLESGQQWDLPNAWPPLQSIIINGLYTSGDTEAKKVAKILAEQWLKSNYIGYQKYQAMFEKYDVNRPGESGGGGEYAGQKGFGWTNGVVLELLKMFYTK